MAKWMKWDWRVVGGAMAGLLLWASSPVLAEDLLPKAGTWSFGTRSGYTFGLDNKDVEMVPVHLHIGYTMFNGKLWFLPEGSFEIGVEPFASVITDFKQHRGSGSGDDSGDSGEDELTSSFSSSSETKKRVSGSNEFGLALPMFTYYFNLGGNIVPYLTAGTGIMYKDLRGLRLGGHFTFMETAGVGIAYFVSKDVSLSAEWRFRHMSNAGIYNDNVGLNSSQVMAGFSYYLPN
ncbi:MAG: acyloxyacyl hydrolase [Deltaproteobacteria bacterium]|nr:acyloxyacyl hydrolase [Deltaproteobacteria bacterium]